MEKCIQLMFWIYLFSFLIFSGPLKYSLRSPTHFQTMCTVGTGIPWHSLFIMTMPVTDMSFYITKRKRKITLFLLRTCDYQKIFADLILFQEHQPTAKVEKNWKERKCRFSSVCSYGKKRMTNAIMLLRTVAASMIEI